MSTAPLLLKGLALGWSVAWPPGPINAEMIRRSLARGFWPAYAVGLGACSGDFLWAVLVSLGAGVIVEIPGVRLGMGVVSLVLLLVLCRVFLLGAWRAWKAHRAGEPPPQRKALESTRGGFALGLTMALSSPWNIAFWLAVIGQESAAEPLTLGASLVFATAVITGAALWGVILCAAVRMGARFATPMWEIVTQGATSALMLVFAVRVALRLAEL